MRYIMPTLTSFNHRNVGIIYIYIQIHRVLGLMAQNALCYSNLSNLSPVPECEIVTNSTDVLCVPLPSPPKISGRGGRAPSLRSISMSPSSSCACGWNAASSSGPWTGRPAVLGQLGVKRCAVEQEFMRKPSQELSASKWVGFKAHKPT